MIRIVTPIDIVVLKDLVVGLDDGRFELDFIIKDMDEENIGLSFVYAEDEKIIGYLAARRRPNSRIHISYLAVDSAHRSQGIGAELMKHLDTVLPANTKIIDLNVLKSSADVNRLIKFYNKFGYTQAGENMKKYRMVKVL